MKWKRRHPVYYNEFDPFAATWLRELIWEGVIPAGDVDERDIREVEARDLGGYVQCHFFAGIGGWARALEIAKWPEDRPVWTGSCPCQPFSAAGKGRGDSDPRHLWPAWFRLIRECRPRVVFGEQVEAAIRHGWLDLVSTNMEGEGYAFGACVLGAHSVGAPHIRQRVWFVADAERKRTERGSTDKARPSDARSGRAGELFSTARSAGGDVGTVADAEDAHGRRGERGAEEGAWPDGERRRGSASGRSDGVVAHSLPAGRAEWRAGSGSGQVASGGWISGMADTEHAERRPLALHRGHGRDGQDDGRTEAHGEPGARCEVRGMADAERWPTERRGHDLAAEARGAESRAQERQRLRSNPWASCEFIPCRDGKARPTQPGIFPLAHGVPNRVGTLRGAGNAIVPAVAAAFIRAYTEVE